MRQQDLTKTRYRAKTLAQSFQRMIGSQSSAPTEVATVVDTTFHLPNGTVQASTRKGIVEVVGCPLNTVCPGMNIFVRQTNQAGRTYYIFDAYAPGTLTSGNTSGVVLSLTGTYTSAGTLGNITFSGQNVSGPTVIPTPPATPSWFWSFFFYLSALPSSGGFIVLCDTVTNGSASAPLVSNQGMRLVVDYQGHLGVGWFGGASAEGQSLFGNFTYSSQVFAPQKVWFVTCQSGNGVSINGITLPNTDPLQQRWTTGVGGNPIPNLVAGQWAHFLMGDSFGYWTPPAGSWISKFTFGCYQSGGISVWPYPTGTIPSSDSQIVTGNATLGSGLTVYNRYLCNDLVPGYDYELTDTGIANAPLLVYNINLNNSIPTTTGPY